MHSLETELKQWMQQEAMNWSAPTTNSTQNKSQATRVMSTSIDKLFADQQVQLDDVHVPVSSHSTEPTPTPASSPPHPTNTQYNNTMNSGDLGEGLSAFDSLQSSFATV
jgi:hypothetical protein